MKVTRTKEALERSTADMVVVPWRKGGDNPGLARLDRISKGSIGALAERERFDGQEGRVLVWQGASKRLPGRVAAIGLGRGRPGASAWRTAVARAVALAARHRLGSVAVYSDDPDTERVLEELGWCVEGLALGGYRFDRHRRSRSGERPPKQGRAGLYGDGIPPREADERARRARARADAVCLARDLVNEPANVLGPSELADRAVEIAKKGSLRCAVLDEGGLADRGFGSILAVARGSRKQPRFVHMAYEPEGAPTRRVVLVGKGVTFDSGGLCLKPRASMDTMKTDMAGAATVLAVMSALPALRPPVAVHGIVPAAENAVGGDAYRPGDVIRTYSGLTVEITNTDAEGRLLLADALSYAKELEPDEIVDFATLTGACVVALGEQTAGLFSTDDDRASRYLACAEREGEPAWRLPLSPSLEKELKSDVADLKNFGGRYGGAISAALFLKRFVEKTPWIHMDIAGPARAGNATPLCPRGGTGFGVLSCLRYLERAPL